MKRTVSILLVILMFVCCFAVPASAATPSQTKVTAKKGDEVIYSLNLTVPEKVVGCDLSVYYDSKQLKPIASADFTGSFDPEKQQAFLNHEIADDARCVFSLLNGVDFSKERTIFSVKFQAKQDIKDAHISYYVRYLYPLDKDPNAEIVQFKEYKFTCDVTVNGKKVTDSKAPELNTEDKQSQGEFINSVTGDGKDANVNMVDKSATTNKKPNNNNNNNSNNTDNKNNVDNKVDKNKPNNTNKTDKNNKTENKKNDKNVVDKNTAIDNNINSANSSSVDTAKKTSSADTATKDAESGNIFTSPWFWIGVAVVVLAAGTAMFFIVIKKKK